MAQKGYNSKHLVNTALYIPYSYIYFTTQSSQLYNFCKNSTLYQSEYFYFPANATGPYY